MSLFQCDNCGVCENTSCSNASHAYHNNHLFKGENARLAIESYRIVLGLPVGAALGAYCSVCTPFWFTAKGDLGIGPNPDPRPGSGVWHNRFPMEFFPKGTMRTDQNGNLAVRT
jgi:hypothetical protein